MKYLYSIAILILTGTIVMGSVFAKEAPTCVGSEQLLKIAMDLHIDYDNITIKSITKVERYLSKIKTTAKKQRNSCQVKEVDNALVSLKTQKASFSKVEAPTKIISFPQQNPLNGQQIQQIPQPIVGQISPISPSQQESRKITCSLADQNLIQQTRKSIAEAETNIKDLTDKVTFFENSERGALSIKIRQRLEGFNINSIAPEAVRNISDTVTTEMNERIRSYRASLEPLIQEYKLYLLQTKPLLGQLEYGCNFN